MIAPGARFVGLAALVGAVLAGAAGEARAHGGRFVVQPPPMPGAPDTPWRDPYSPTPPTPYAPGGPTPVPTSPTTPRTPPTTGPQTPPRARATTGDPRAGWREWWDANEEAVRATRRAGPFVTGDSPLFRIGGSEQGNRADAERPTRRAVERDVLPLLRSLVEADKKEDPDVRAASLLAIGKLASDPADVARLLEASRPRAAPDLVRESSLLALGLLRRTPAEDRLPARTLDEVRERLFEAIDDEGLHVRARCFAAFALGLLADQPSGDDEYSCDGRQTVRGLWTRLSGRHASEEIPVALLVALSLQPSRGIPEAVRGDLRTLATAGRVGVRSYGPLVRAHAVLALARLEGAAQAGTFLGMAKSRTFDLQVRRSAVCALGLLADALDAEQRAQAAAALLEVARSGDPDTAGLATVTVGRLLLADFAAGSSTVAERTKAPDLLLRSAEAGPHGVRPFAALALAIASRAAGSAADVPAFAELQVRAVAALREGASSEGVDPDTRGAYCVAIGLVEDVRSAGVLRAVLAKPSLPEDLRGYACVGLGLLGVPGHETRAVLRTALAEPSETIRRQAARALGLLGDTGAVPSLLRDLEAGGPDHVVARLAIALGDVRDVSAVPPLVAIARRRGGVADATRAVACAALGLLCDLEPMPSLSRLGTDGNPTARTDALAEALSLL